MVLHFELVAFHTLDASVATLEVLGVDCSEIELSGSVVAYLCRFLNRDFDVALM
jgi:hypothetical protein